ncbi:uncharacterized protein LOC143062408 [Mytilus galloprovincialis]|uniref:uncharacterized protein LOC143062408 n=1 Tax=Mytilus galloprovincialis TaxID=29158 RepID=UPI003F7BADD4
MLVFHQMLSNMDIHSYGHKRHTESATYQEISGSFTIIVEVLMILVNCLPLFVIIRWKKYSERTTTDDLIVVLSILYILSVLVPTPLGHLSYFRDKWYGGDASCQFYQVTTNWFRLSTIFIVSILCIDKSLALHFYIKHNFTARYHGKTKLIFAIFTAITVALIVSCFPVLGFGPLRKARNKCGSWINEEPVEPKEFAFIGALLTSGYGNFLCAILTNLSMVLNLKKVKRSLYRSNNGPNQRDEIRWQLEGVVVIHSVKMVMAVSILLYITWFPALLLMTLQQAGLTVSDISVLYALLSTTLSGLLNPILYGLFDTSYRRGYKNLFKGLKQRCCCCTKVQDSVPAVSMTNGISRSRSDSTSLSRNAESNIPRSLSRISEETSGLQNDAFSDTYPLTHETILPKRCVSGIVRTFSREMNNRSADEETALLDSSPFGNPKTLEENRSSSSSLISSDLDSFDENQSESGEDDEDEEGFEVESTF